MFCDFRYWIKGQQYHQRDYKTVNMSTSILTKTCLLRDLILAHVKAAFRIFTATNHQSRKLNFGVHSGQNHIT